MEYLYYFEVQVGWAPGCGWLRSPYGRDTFEKAWNEAQAYARNAMTAGQHCGIAIVRVAQ